MLKTSWMPFLYRTVPGREDGPDILGRFSIYYLAVLAIPALTVVLLAREFILLIGDPRYNGVYPLVPWFILIYFIQAMTAAITTLASRPNRMRREQFAGGEVTVSAFDGTTLWTSRGGGPAREAPGPQAAYARQDAEFDSVFVDFREKGHAISLVGRDRRDGADVFHLKVTKKGGPPQDYYLDAATGLERAVSVTLQGPAGPVTIATEFGDYRKQDGRMLPFSIRQRVNGTVTASTIIETVEFNVPVDAAAFTMPRGK